MQQESEKAVTFFEYGMKQSVGKRTLFWSQPMRLILRNSPSFTLIIVMRLARFMRISRDIKCILLRSCISCWVLYLKALSQLLFGKQVWFESLPNHLLCPWVPCPQLRGDLEETPPHCDLCVIQTQMHTSQVVRLSFQIWHLAFLATFPVD